MREMRKERSEKLSRFEILDKKGRRMEIKERRDER